MVDNINTSQGNSKEWIMLDKTTKDAEYNKVLDKKINSILQGQETISLQTLKKNSLFSNLSEKALERFNYIAGIDGDNKSFNAEELKVLLALSDATLKNNQFVFDNSYKINNNSGLIEATDNEVESMIQNLVKSNVRARIKQVDTSKYDRNQEFSKKIKSSDANEVMLALSDELQSGYTDKTGKKISILQAVMMFENFKWQYPKMDYEALQNKFKEETGIQIEDFGRYRGPGGDRYKIGDWEYDIPENLGENKEFDTKILYNRKTGEKLKLSYTKSWYNSTNYTVPAANGFMFYVQEYKNKDSSTSIKFNYEDSENLAPTSAEVQSSGENKVVKYNPVFYIDTELYNFRQNSIVKNKKTQQN